MAPRGRPAGWRKPEDEKKKRVYVSLQPGLYVRLLEVCEKTGFSKGDIIESLVDIFLDEVGKG